MNDEKLRAQMKDYLKGWAEASEYLERERRERVRTVDTAEALSRLSGLFDSAVWLHQPSAASGLVEQQAVFARTRR